MKDVKMSIGSKSWEEKGYDEHVLTGGGSFRGDGDMPQRWTGRCSRA